MFKQKKTLTENATGEVGKGGGRGKGRGSWGQVNEGRKEGEGRGGGGGVRVIMLHTESQILPKGKLPVQFHFSTSLNRACLPLSLLSSSRVLTSNIACPAPHPHHHPPSRPSSRLLPSTSTPSFLRPPLPSPKLLPCVPTRRSSIQHVLRLIWV